MNDSVVVIVGDDVVFVVIIIVIVVDVALWMLGCLERASPVVPGVADGVVVGLGNRDVFGCNGRTDLLLRHPCHSPLE